ncbi:MAG: hypothetical protein QNL04_03105 [SAR324 cluster bacterium]|nr:hypothetical protein [SAR324 cluster bacterium]
MDTYIFQEFFFWCFVINFGLYTFSALAILIFKGLVVTIHQKLFGFDEATTLKEMHRYLAKFKLLVIIFNFTPWLSLYMINGG